MNNSTRSGEKDLATFVVSGADASSVRRDPARPASALMQQSGTGSAADPRGRAWRHRFAPGSVVLDVRGQTSGGRLSYTSGSSVLGVGEQTGEGHLTHTPGSSVLDMRDQTSEGQLSRTSGSAVVDVRGQTAGDLSQFRSFVVGPHTVDEKEFNRPWIHPSVTIDESAARAISEWPRVSGAINKAIVELGRAFGQGVALRIENMQEVPDRPELFIVVHPQADPAQAVAQLLAFQPWLERLPTELRALLNVTLRFG